MGRRVYLLYLDDGGSVGNADEEYFTLAGVCVHEGQIHHLSQGLDGVVERAGYPVSKVPDIELRGADILGGKKQWRKDPERGRSGRIPDEKKRRIIRHSLAEVDRLYRWPALFAVAIEKRSCSENPVDYAFEQLCNRFDIYIARKNKEEPQDFRQRGLLVLDTSARDTELKQKALQFKHSGHRWGPLVNLADTPYFVDSKASRLTQYADLVATSVRRYFEYGESEFLDVIRDKFDESDGRCHGFVHFPQPDDITLCSCPYCS